MHVTTYFIIAVIIIVVFLLFRSEHKFEFLKAAIFYSKSSVINDFKQFYFEIQA